MGSVSLNIGGTKFITSLSTLTKYEGMLKAMFTSDLGLTRQSDESIFIDRDPTHFRKILNFLRDGDVPMPESVEHVLEIKKEAEYYCLEGLYAICMDKLFPNGMPPCQKNRFWFTVGGQKFSATSDEVKRHGGLLKEKFEEKEEYWRSKTTKWETCTEVLFEIDRDPTTFRHILSFLTNNQMQPFPITDMEKVRDDADFYGLPAIKKHCDREFQLVCQMRMVHPHMFRHPWQAPQ